MKIYWSSKDTKIIGMMLAAGVALFYAGTHDLPAVVRSPQVLPPAQNYLGSLVPHAPASAYHYSVLRTGPLEVAKVFGRSHGCQAADSDFIEAVSKTAIYAGLDPGLFASAISTESSCNQFAVSSRGAIGYTQVVPAYHKTEWDFSIVNLFNRDDNLRVGAAILAASIRQFGTTSGVARYQGLASTCDDAHHCNPNYTNQVIGGAKGYLPAQNPPKQGVSLQPSSPTPQP